MSLALFAILGQVLSAAAAISRSKAGYLPGEMPRPDYGDRVYRICRTYHNTVDNAGTFAAAVAAAVLTLASPVLVNLFAVLALIARLLFVAFYVKGGGRPDGGPRSIAYVFQSAMTILLALLAVSAGIT